MQEIPHGFCHCGCGSKTSLAKYTLKAKGWKIGMPVKFLPGHHIRTTETVFWDKADKDGGNGCWVWRGYKGRGGYGMIMFRGRKWLTHRLSWYLTHGPIPDELLVLHKCDNPQCVNPDHLFIGTDKDNSDDMWGKGRAVRLRGENHSMSKLTWDRVQIIRELCGTKALTPNAAAEQFGVCRTTVRNIMSNKIWTSPR